MANQVDDDFQLAVKMSMQHAPPEPTMINTRDIVIEVSSESPEKSPGGKNRMLQRELMAAAAEKCMSSEEAKSRASTALSSRVEKGVQVTVDVAAAPKEENSREKMSSEEAACLFTLVFGDKATNKVLAQWSNQGIRFSPDQETSMGLVQHEGGPCGVLAAIQAFVLKYLLFIPEELVTATPNRPVGLGSRRLLESECESEVFGTLSEDTKLRALVRSMGEILFLCGSNERATIVSLSNFDLEIKGSEESSNDEITIAKAFGSLSIKTSCDWHKDLTVSTFTSLESAILRLEEMIPVFQSGMGVLLFLISALLSRGLDNVKSDRDDLSQPLVTAPFGHASQEIVNLLLSGRAVANVFDGSMDLGDGMFLKGISSKMEVGFLTLIESFHLCKVGQYLKCPKWPIWIVGSETHYTVLFALDPKIQDENKLEERETQIRRAFDAQDQSGGGGFIVVECVHQVLKDASIDLPPEKVDQLCDTGFIVWSDFRNVLFDLDKSSGGLKDSAGVMGKKVFDLYHFNGIAKSVSGNENPSQKPRLTKLRVMVPPMWTPEEYNEDTVVEVSRPEPPSQEAPLVNVIRTRWARAACNWDGDSPSIV